MNAQTLLDTTAHRAKLTTRDYMVLAEAGVFEEFSKTELIDGDLFVVNAQFRRHWWARRQLVRAFDAALEARSDGIVAADECSVEMGPNDMPQPDITLTTDPFGPGPVPLASVKLIVEIADTTLDRDLGEKRALYARHGIPEYWVVDVEGKIIHQHWAPRAEGYASARQIAFGDEVVAEAVVGLQVATAGLV